MLRLRLLRRKRPRLPLSRLGAGEAGSGGRTHNARPLTLQPWSAEGVSIPSTAASAMGRMRAAVKVDPT